MFPREAFRMLTAAISAALLLLFGFFFYLIILSISLSFHVFYGLQDQLIDFALLLTLTLINKQKDFRKMLFICWDE
jgi:hypothetical protein